MTPRLRRPLALLAIAAPALAFAGAPLGAQRFTVEQVKSYPYPTELAAAAAAGRLAWAMDERGLRNVYVAEAPGYTARRLTSYRADDGQEITSVSLARDGGRVVYVRGGEHGGNWEGPPPNPTSAPSPPKVQIWAVPFAGGEPRLVADGDEPAVAPNGMRVAFVRDRQIWVADLDGAAPPRRLVAANGTLAEPTWSPDGARLAFVSSRGDHAFIGVFSSDSAPITWLAPSTSRDASPRWSPDGRRIAFVRQPGAGGTPDSALVPRHVAWSLWTADAATGAGRQLWRTPETLRGSFPTTHGGANLHWAALGRIVFLSYADGWPHLYSVAESGGEPVLLTPGSWMAEHVSLSPDRRTVVFAANAGPAADDVDRRHVVRVPVDRAAPEVVTPGAGLEWSPVVAGDGTLAYISATAQRPPLPTVKAGAAAPRLLAGDRVPAEFPEAQLVTPRRVVFHAPDAVEVHGQLFARPSAARRPAIIYVHGGPPRQMLLGWHYSDYYANAYALNQYLASRGYVVLSVNYRLGIGYGREFQHPADGGSRGAAEYADVKAAAEWLRAQPDVDPARIGIYGGSYGGYLTALALARNSDLFAAGVDIHGVHDWTAERARPLLGADRYEKIPDAPAALDVAWRSSPVASVATWRSPVLLIHGDDDRNVRFSQTVDLARRLAAAKVPFEEIVIPDDTHHFFRWANWVRVDAATADFFDRMLVERKGRAAGGASR